MATLSHDPSSPRVVLITGAASGLGWALTQRCHARGDLVVLVDRDVAGLETRIATLGGHRCHAIPCELTIGESRDELVARVHVEVGRLDVLIHNAGITHRSPAKRTAPAVIRQVMEVNYHAPVALTHALLPLLQASRGSLVVVSSMAGWMPVPGRAGYGASKAALTQYTEVLRLELERDGVHVLTVHPSFLDTPIEQHALGADGTPARHPRSMVGRIRSADWQAGEILAAVDARRPMTRLDPLPAFGALLWRVFPGLFRWQMRRRFRGEFD